MSVLAKEEFNFVPVTKLDKTRIRWDAVSISASNGMVRLSLSLVEKYFTDVDYVQVFLDAERQVIGIKPANKNIGSKERFVLRGGKKDQRSKTFSMVHVIKDEKIAKGVYDANWSKKYEMIIFKYQKQKAQPQHA